MATKEQIAISNPVPVDNASFGRVVAKNKIREEKELLHLGTILKLLEEEIRSAKSGAGLGASEAKGDKIVELNPSHADKPNQGPSNTAFENAMAELAFMLQQLQAKIAKFSEKHAESDARISKGLVEAAEANLKSIEHKIKKIKKKQEKEKHASMWEKVGEAVLGALTVTVGALLAQPEIVVMGVLSLASSTGVFEQIAKHLVAPNFEAMGMDSKGADILADGLVCAAVIGTSMAFCDPEQAVEETAETSASVAEDATNVGMESFDVEEDVQTSTFQQMMQAIKDSPAGQVASKIKGAAARLSRALGPRIKMGLFAALTTTQSTQFTTKLSDVIMKARHIPEEKRKKIEADLNYALMAVSIIASFAVIGGSASNASRAATLSPEDTNMLSKAQKAIYNLGLFGTTTASVYEGRATQVQGDLQEELGEDQGNMKMFESQLGILNNETKQEQTFEADALQTQRVGDQSITKLMQGEAAFANLFTQHSPV